MGFFSARKEMLYLLAEKVHENDVDMIAQTF